MSDYYVTTLTLADGTSMRVTESDLDGPRGVRGLPNRVFYEAKAAAEREMEERLAKNAAGPVTAEPVEVKPQREWYV